MRHRLFFAAALLLVLAALIVSEVRKAQAPVGPQAFLFFIADTQHELTRLPMAYTRISDEQEMLIGDQLASSAGSRPASEAGAEGQSIEKYVQAVGDLLAKRAQRKLRYRFHYIPDMDFVNAFALPGGHVFIGAGLMAQMESADELAAVIGHEIEHIDHYHCAERLQTEAALQKIPFGQLLSLPVAVFQAGYSKDQELEADREGTSLAVAASYSPLGAIHLFETFQRLEHREARASKSPGEELSKIAQQTLEGYFQSHPPSAERADQIRRLFARELQTMNQTRALPCAYVFLRERAGRLLQAGKFKEAAEMVGRSLELQPGQPVALVVLAESQLGLRDLKGSGATYQKLLSLDPAGANAVRAFADELATKAFAAGRYKESLGLTLLSLQLQPNKPEALALRAQCEFAQSDFVAGIATTRKLKSLYPDKTDSVREYAGTLANRAYIDQNYAVAARLTELILELNPSDRQALQTLAWAKFLSTDFPAAARNFRKLAGGESSGDEAEKKVANSENEEAGLVQLYADALAAAGRPLQSVNDFQAFARGKGYSGGVKIELAGLMLLAGNSAPAQAIIAGIKTAATDAIAPELLGRMGWWYCKAGKAEAASHFLQVAAQQRPGDAGLQNALAWAELQNGTLVEATQGFRRTGSAQGYSRMGNTPTMGLAIALWQTGETDQALRDFESASKMYPQWLNLRWVKAIYSPAVAGRVAEIQAARQAQTEFDSAHFAAAAAAYRNLLALLPLDGGLQRRYADALSAGGRREESVAKFQKLTAFSQPADSAAAMRLRIDLAGLKLLAGDEATARDLISQAEKASGQVFSSESLCRLAWWYFRTGATPVSLANLLRRATQLSPEEPLARTQLGWAELEQQNPDFKSILQRFNPALAILFPLGNGPAVGRAVTLWRAGQREAALADFVSAAGEFPPLRNPEWIAALYPTAVAHTVGEMLTEYQKRVEAQRSRTARPSQTSDH